MLLKSEENILKLLKLGPLFIIFISAIAMYVIFNSNNKLLERELTQIKQQSVLEKKALIKREVESVYDLIRVELSQTKLKIKQDIKNRVTEAHTIANSIYQNNRDKDDKTIQKLIFDALRDIRFNEGRGYFFIYEHDGKNVMHPILSNIVGKDLWDFQDKNGMYIMREFKKIAHQYEEGFLTWWWTKPKDLENTYEKIGFVKTFEPYNWYIGSGEYVVDYENALKKKLLYTINKIRFGEEGYVFIVDKEGTYLSHVKKENVGKNRINLQDKNGVMITKEIIKTGQEGEGYISYVGTIQPSTGNPAEKISFIKGFEKWDWAIGAGVYVDELNAQIKERNDFVVDSNSSQFKKIFYINLLIFSVLFFASLYLSRVTKKRFLTYNRVVKAKAKELRTLNNTLEHKVEERTNEQNSLLSLFEKSDSVLVRWNNDENWSVDYISSNVANLLGYEKEEFLSGAIDYVSCIHKDDLQQTIDEDEYRKKEGKEFFRHAPYRVITKEGIIKWILEYNLIIRNEEGDITHYLGYILDDTANQKAREELEVAKAQAIKASQAKSEFLANMSHEIRTPMNGIIGMTTLALSKIDTNKEEAKDFTKKAKNSAKMLLGVINDILDFSKIEARKIDIEKTEVSLGEILSQMNDLFSYTASQKDIKFTIEQESIVPEYIITDKLRLTQVITNLLSNAIKFTQKGSISLKIELLSKKDENIELKFFISDTGKGIAKENQGKLFNSFSQEDSSISRNYGGTGLGLTISKSLVELMGGEIGFESVENEGSTFFFTIPTKLVKEENIRKKEPKINVSNEEKILNTKILLVEDNDINQELAYNFLKQIVKEVDIANNGQEAIDMLESKEKGYYKLVLMDIHMPVLDGNSATIKIKENSKYKDLPVVAMTANVLKRDLEYSMQCGMCDYVIKPFEVQELFDKVKYWINKNQKVEHIIKEEKIELEKKVEKSLDTKLAIDRMVGQKEIYKGFLKSFLDSKVDSLKELQDLLNEKNIYDAITKVHTLKGVTGTLGAMKLSNIFALMQESLESKQIIEEDLMSESQEEFDQVIKEIEKWISQN